MATLIKANKSEVMVFPKANGRFTLEELQHFVGGYIEEVRFKKGEVMIVNEDGKIKGLPANAEATEIYLSEFPPNAYETHDTTIYGDVLFFEVEELDEIMDRDSQPEEGEEDV